MFKPQELIGLLTQIVGTKRIFTCLLSGSNSPSLNYYYTRPSHNCLTLLKPSLILIMKILKFLVYFSISSFGRSFIHTKTFSFIYPLMPAIIIECERFSFYHSSIVFSQNFSWKSINQSMKSLSLYALESASEIEVGQL